MGFVWCSFFFKVTLHPETLLTSQSESSEPLCELSSASRWREPECLDGFPPPGISSSYHRQEILFRRSTRYRALVQSCSYTRHTTEIIRIPLNILKLQLFIELISQVLRLIDLLWFKSSDPHIFRIKFIWNLLTSRAQFLSKIGKHNLYNISDYTCEL
jgi:hypothetical protein